MKRIKLIISFIFVAALVAGLANQSFAYPPFVKKARQFGARDCTFCHVNPDGGPPFNNRGQWLIGQKEQRKADTVNPEWLADYKAGQPGAGKGAAETVASASVSPVEKELTGLFGEMVEAVKKRDAEKFGRLLAADFVETNPEGMVIDKAQVMAAFPNLILEAFNVEESKTRVFGDAAVMTYRESSKWTYQGQTAEGVFRVTMMWVKHGGRWQVAAAHVSRLPAK